MHTIENERFVMKIKEKGAELVSFFDKNKNVDYIWNEEKPWGGSSPILFPNIGGYVDDKFLYNGVEYESPYHGFAINSEFKTESITENTLVQSTQYNDETLKMLPFKYKLFITHILHADKIEINYEVKNLDDKEIYFSIGAHPGFKLINGSDLEDYKIVLDKEIDFRYYTGEDSLISAEKRVTDIVAPKGTKLKEFVLKKELWKKSAAIFDEGINSMNLINEKIGYNVKVTFNNFPIVALWTHCDTVLNAPFICIEPWYGVNDFCGQEIKEIKDKKHIQKADVNSSFFSKYFIEIL